jgi:ribosome-binding factor A
VSTIRQEQVQHQLIKEVSDMLLRDLKDPRLGFVTVTGAEITRDLRFAKVFVSVLGTDEQRVDCMAALRRAAGRVRGEFGRRAGLRVAPEIDFREDTGIARGARIAALLHDIEPELKANEGSPEPDSGSDPPRQ